MVKKIFIVIIVLISSTVMLMSQDDENQLSWPREIETEEGSVITLYQPQLESFENNELVGRMAISVKPKDKDLVFGAVWFLAKLITDLDNRIAVLDELSISQTHFPDVESDKVETFARLLEDEIEGWDLEMSLDRLLASLEVVEVYQKQSSNLNNDPPEIYFRTAPAFLVYIDGDPILMDTEESGIKYVANTPYFLVNDEKDGNYYLKAAKWWYTSRDAISAWSTINKVPGKVKSLQINQLMMMASKRIQCLWQCGKHPKSFYRPYRLNSYPLMVNRNILLLKGQRCFTLTIVRMIL